MTLALVLSGGGARAAYQVGVLRAVSELLGKPATNPFPIICGTSAGAINAALLACESDNFSVAVTRLDALWRGLRSADVHEMGTLAVLTSLARLTRSFFNDGHNDVEPWSLLDNAPLRDLLSRVIRFEHLGARIRADHLEALSISALGYTSGSTLSFFQGNDRVTGWRRHRRIGVRGKLTLDHLMASTAIPGVYPAVPIHREYFGDGAVRQTAPLSPALHLGARKLFVIGVSHNPQESPAPREMTSHSPSLAQMTMHFLNGSFIDALEEDMEDLKRINEVVARLSVVDRAALGLAPVDVLCITPSRAFDEIAGNHVSDLPRSMRFLFNTLGATRAGGGASLASYLMFEAPFLVELMDCGYRDAMNEAQAITRFFGVAPSHRVENKERQ